MFNNDDFSNFYSILEDLSKADLSLSNALSEMKKVSPSASKAIAKHLYIDTLTNCVGNLFAYNDFLTRNNNTAIHISLDFNGLKNINDEHGHIVGDQAIKQGFKIISEVSRKYGLKAFRTGGDESRLHAPTTERANGFVKELTQRLEASPKIAGQHRLSVSIGLGYSPEHAEKALIKAKDQLGPLVDGKRQKINKPGEEKTVYHSLLNESPPDNWKPFSGKIQPVQNEAPSVDSPLKLNNPLK